MIINSKEIINFRKKIRMIEREIMNQIKDDTTCCGITLSQCHVLLELNEINETSIKDMSRILGLDNSTLSRTIDSMVKEDLVNRNIKPEDRRYMTISLTVKGKDKADSINDLCDNYYSELFNCIPEDKRNSVIDCISILAEAINELRKR